jgi:hypothetical protein
LHQQRAFFFGLLVFKSTGNQNVETTRQQIPRLQACRINQQGPDPIPCREDAFGSGAVASSVAHLELRFSDIVIAFGVGREVNVISGGAQSRALGSVAHQNYNSTQLVKRPGRLTQINSGESHDRQTYHF